ncbi:hypothetical protein AURDEDRAFT_170762 [Auricularia subglabra TFB-10046 SS5]|uniref:Uncharacterized protein n=1 Tax=Auricularia subglabra (strain TFB-10046 / SS5) TaxID=717982 RepID=J0DCN3_AURST|nr:hypothetical protein AURDEDRAFT_170762 [Auricularia subglabra TFB-10046 SS5]
MQSPLFNALVDLDEGSLATLAEDLLAVIDADQPSTESSFGSLTPEEADAILAAGHQLTFEDLYANDGLHHVRDQCEDAESTPVQTVPLAVDILQAYSSFFCAEKDQAVAIAQADGSTDMCESSALALETAATRHSLPDEHCADAASRNVSPVTASRHLFPKNRKHGPQAPSPTRGSGVDRRFSPYPSPRVSVRRDEVNVPPEDVPILRHRDTDCIGGVPERVESCNAPAQDPTDSSRLAEAEIGERRPCSSCPEKKRRSGQKPKVYSDADLVRHIQRYHSGYQDKYGDRAECIFCDREFAVRPGGFREHRRAKPLGNNGSKACPRVAKLGGVTAYEALYDFLEKSVPINHWQVMEEQSMWDGLQEVAQVRAGAAAGSKA